MGFVVLLVGVIVLGLGALADFLVVLIMVRALCRWRAVPVLAEFDLAGKPLVDRTLRRVSQLWNRMVPNRPIDGWRLLVAFVGWMNRHQQDMIDYIQEENCVLRTKLKGRRIRFTMDDRRRLAVKGKALGRSVLDQVASIVTPGTILRWHRNLIAAKYDSSSKRGPGRPRVQDEIPKLTVRMAQENPSWGYTPIRGALFNLRHSVARETVRNILKEHGIVPAPERGRKTSWSTFLKSHWNSIAAADFFSIEVWSAVGLTRYHVLFLIKLSTRRVYVAGVTEYPHGKWMEQVGRNLTDGFDGFLLDVRYLILDRDPLYTAAFRNLLKDANVKSVRLPPRSPNLNAYAERFVRTIKETCLNRMIFFGEASLRKAINEFLVFYHHERNHQWFKNRLIEPRDAIGTTEGSVERRERQGGVLRYYYRKAA